MSSPFSRTLPGNPSLAQQKKQAKELLQSFTAGDPEARARVRAASPRQAAHRARRAQFVLAREYGFTDWSMLKQHIDALEEQQRPHTSASPRRSAGAIRTRYDGSSSSSPRSGR